MSLWSDRVVQPLMDRALDTPEMAALRREQLADAVGRILEIGFGSGLSLDCYPDHVHDIVAVDPSPGRRRRAAPRIARSGRVVRYETLGAERLPFDDESFDTVTSAFTLCSIDDLDRALGEVRRVLRLGGRFLFLEHGIAPHRGVRTLQTLLNPLQRRVADGCQLVKDPPAAIERAGLTVERRRSFYDTNVPRFLGWFTIGLARREA
jgi:ubiquinone/menaquinone biosynthesis C-methylase UbiE